MSELSSQFYTHRDTELRCFHAPHWVQWRIIHPLSGERVEAGRTGVLEIFDLANTQSAIAIRTEDLAHESDGGFILDGRIPLAAPKGCSLNT